MLGDPLGGDVAGRVHAQSRGADLLGGLCQNLRCHALTAEGVVHKGMRDRGHAVFSRERHLCQKLAVCIKRKNTAFLMLEINIVHLGASIAGFERDDKNQRK